VSTVEILRFCISRLNEYDDTALLCKMKSGVQIKTGTLFCIDISCNCTHMCACPCRLRCRYKHWCDSRYDWQPTCVCISCACTLHRNRNLEISTAPKKAIWEPTYSQALGTSLFRGAWNQLIHRYLEPAYSEVLGGNNLFTGTWNQLIQRCLEETTYSQALGTSLFRGSWNQLIHRPIHRYAC